MPPSPEPDPGIAREIYGYPREVPHEVLKKDNDSIGSSPPDKPLQEKGSSWHTPRHRTPIKGRVLIEKLSKAISFGLVSLACFVVGPTLVEGKPEGPRAFCETYPESPSCLGSLITCEYCHTSTVTGSPAWNPFGIEILVAGYMPPFESGVVDVLPLTEDLDSDGDGITNIEEILAGTLPGDSSSLIVLPSPPAGDDNPMYNVEGYDLTFAIRRVTQVYCGRSISFAEAELFENSPEPYETLHGALDLCLESEYWKTTALSRMADPAIRPIDFGSAWGWDYRLFRYVMSGDRDMRDLLLGDYNVREINGTLVKIEGVIPGATDEVCDPANPQCDSDQDCLLNGPSGQYRCSYINGGQLATPDTRAGMITTAWFHFYNTMFSAMPRQTAAQAYRGYLGLDIAKQEGLLPVENEPVDYDNKGVQQAECAQCHSTLDPLSYPFAYYNGIGDGAIGVYNPERPANKGLWELGEEPQALILGVPVDDLVEWAEVGASSEQFQRKLALIFYKHAIGHSPSPEGMEEFTELWQAIPDDNYNANALNHRLIDLMAFGGP